MDTLYFYLFVHLFIYFGEKESMLTSHTTLQIRLSFLPLQQAGLLDVTLLSTMYVHILMIKCSNMNE